MLFTIIRLVVFSMFFIISLLIIRKTNVKHKHKWSIVSFVISIVLTTILALTPIEKSLITFSSLEAAYNYNHSGSIELIVEGEMTDFVVGTKDDTYIYAVIPKVTDGWKIGIGSDVKKFAKAINDGITINVYRYKNTSDYFITVLDTKGGATAITDKYNSEFKISENFNSTLNKTFYTYYAYINNFDEQYSVNVNGKTIKIQE